jgi:hypothetical protein
MGRNNRRTSGHAGPHNRTNGHAPASTERGEIAVNGNPSVSDDASGASVANAATSPAGGAQEVHLPGPTDYEAMQDAGAYVNAVAERVDLVAASARLVQSTDEKIAKSELDRLRDMKFGKVGAAILEEPVRVDFGDLPRPQR